MGTKFDTLEVEAPAADPGPEFVAVGADDLSAQLKAVLLILARRKAREAPDKEESA